jgi:hypothetical protein
MAHMGRCGGSRAPRAGWSISATARHLGRDREATCLDGIASPGSADHRAGYELGPG